MSVMPRRNENLLTFRAIYDSPIVSVRDYRCSACCGGPSAEERSGGNDIVLIRHGAFSKHFGRRRLTADVNQTVFFSKGSTYRVSHPSDRGDCGTIFTLAPRVLNDMIRELDPSIDDHPEQPFPFVIGPCKSDVFWRHREFLGRLMAANASPPEPLWTEATALGIVADLLEAAFARRDLPRRPRRKETSADYADRAEAAKNYLSGRLCERITLNDVAHAVHVSPFHFARIFQQQIGVPIHRYLTQLRLRAAVERLAGGEKDLTSLALELGFSSHSHFTDTFRGEFGRTPSDVRRDASLRSLREMSKNPEA